MTPKPRVRADGPSALLVGTVGAMRLRRRWCPQLHAHLLGTGLAHGIRVSARVMKAYANVSGVEIERNEQAR